MKKPLYSAILAFGTSVVCTRTMFLFFHDAEGPNLLIVALFSLVIFLLSLVPYMCTMTLIKKFLVAMSIQILLVLSFFFFLH